MSSYFLGLIHKDPDTDYGISFPDVPGCISVGETLEEAISMGAEAIEGHIGLMKDRGYDLPSPRTYEQLRDDKEFQAEVADAIVVVPVPVPSFYAGEPTKEAA